MIEFYAQIRLLHISLAIATGVVFLARGALVLGGRAGLANHGAVRWTSYTIDTVLLTAALMLLTILHLPIAQTSWLMVKLLLLVGYIALGSFALHRAAGMTARRLCFVGAVFAYLAIVGIARAHDPLGWFVTA